MIYGIKGVRDLCMNEDTFYELAALCGKLGIQCRHEDGSSYAGVLLMCTIYGHRLQPPSGVMPIDDLPSQIRRGIGEPMVQRARESWAEARKAAKEELDLALPDGELLWIGDYD